MNIYVVIGSSGEYSEHSEWPVCWCGSLADAESVIDKIEAEAMIEIGIRNRVLDGRPDGSSRTDPLYAQKYRNFVVSLKRYNDESQKALVLALLLSACATTPDPCLKSGPAQPASIPMRMHTSAGLRISTI